MVFENSNDNTLSSSSNSSSSTIKSLNIQWNPYQHKSKPKKKSNNPCTTCCRRSKPTPQSITNETNSEDQTNTSSISSSSVHVYEGSFRSTQASILPPETSECKFLMVVPENAPDMWRPWLPNSTTIVTPVSLANSETTKSSIRNRKEKSSAADKDTNVNSASSLASATYNKVLFWLPATGEQSYSERLKLASILANEQQCISLIIMAPFYASRKENGQKGASVSTVGYYLSQSLAIMTEAAALVLWINELYTNATSNSEKLKNRLHICLTGFSWGAAMSGCAAILSSIALATPPSLPSQNTPKISVIPYVGSTSPAPVVDGILSGDIAWTKLTEQGKSIVPQIDREKVKGMTDEIIKGMEQNNSIYIRKGLLILLQEFNNDYFLQKIVLRYKQVLGSNLTGTAQDLNKIKLFYSLCSCCAKNDWFLGSQYSNQLHLQLAPLVYSEASSSTESNNTSSPTSASDKKPYVQQIWLDGGHVYAYVHRQAYQLDALRSVLEL